MFQRKKNGQKFCASSVLQTIFSHNFRIILYKPKEVVKISYVLSNG